MEKEWSEEKWKQLLKEYLSQYHKRSKEKRRLERRLKIFDREIGPKEIKYSKDTKVRDSRIDDEPADFAIKKEEINERIVKERKACASTMLKIMDIIEFLPPDSKEREILELRHIDDYTWNQIMDEVYMSRSSCNEYWNKGLEVLLGFKRVRAILKEYDNFRTQPDINMCYIDIVKK